MCVWCVCVRERERSARIFKEGRRIWRSELRRYEVREKVNCVGWVSREEGLRLRQAEVL